jgi:Zn-dependent protease with chaperone function
MICRTIFNIFLYLSVMLLAGCTHTNKTDNQNPTTSQYPHQQYLRINKILGIVESPATDDLIEKISRPLRAYYGFGQNYPKIYLVPEFEIAALTTRDGNIYISIGTIEGANNEDEIAAVIAHEMAHVKLNHSSSEDVLDVLTWGLRVVSVAVPYTGGLNKAANTVAIGWTQAVGSVSSIASHNAFVLYSYAGWSRDHESEADAYAVEALDKCNYKASGMIAMLGKFPDVSKGINQVEKNSLFSALSGPGHPTPKDRIDTLKNTKNNYLSNDTLQFHTENLEQWHAKTRDFMNSLRLVISSANDVKGPYTLCGLDLITKDNSYTKDPYLKLCKAFNVQKAEIKKTNRRSKLNSNNSSNKEINPDYNFNFDQQIIDPELKALYRNNLTQIIMLELRSRIDSNNKKAFQNQFIDILSDSKTPQRVLMFKAVSAVANKDIDEGERMIEQIQKQFGSQLNLYPLQHALGMRSSGIPKDTAKDAALQLPVALTLDRQLIKECDTGRKNPDSIIKPYVNYILTEPFWKVSI